MSNFWVLIFATFILVAKSEKFFNKISIDALSWANGIPTTVDNTSDNKLTATILRETKNLVLILKK